MKLVGRHTCGALLAMMCLGTQAQQVYRCGSDGRVYQHTPCAQGKPVDVADPRSAVQQKAGQAVTAGDAKLGNALERDRRVREAASPPAKATGFNARPSVPPVAASAPRKSKSKAKASKEAGSGGRNSSTTDFVAIEPVPRDSKSKSR